MTASYDHPQVHFSPDFRRNPSIPAASHAKTAATLPPIVPGPYGDGGHERTAQPRQQAYQVNGIRDNQPQDSASRRPEPQA
jgi:hypothetical protein